MLIHVFIDNLLSAEPLAQLTNPESIADGRRFQYQGRIYFESATAVFLIIFFTTVKI
jgi:hypothetical protein